MQKNKSLITDDWYSEYINGVSYESCLNNLQISSFFKRRLRANGICKAFYFLYLTFQYDRVVIAAGNPVANFLIIFLGIFGQRKLILLEFIKIEKKPLENCIVKVLFVYTYILIRRFFLSRSLLRAHVLTGWEVQHYATIYKLPTDKFRYIKWPSFASTCSHISPSEKIFDVFVSGRSSMDWRLLSEVLSIKRYRLVIVCAARDLKIVRDAFGCYDCEIYSEIPQSQHNELLSKSHVCFLPLAELYISSAHVRISHANALKIPILCTSVKGVHGYLVDKVNALIANVGDANECVRLIDQLLSNPNLRTDLVHNAISMAAGYDMKKYINTIVGFVNEETIVRS